MPILLYAILGILILYSLYFLLFSGKKDEGQFQTRDSRLIWYFAYGANLHPSTMKRRGIKIHQVKKAKLPKFKLAFNVPGIFLIEPAFANIVYTGNQIDQVKGVIYQIPYRDLLKLAKYERLYKLTPISNSSEIYTFISKNGNVQEPSCRYLSKIINGCKELNLDQEYIRNLALHKCKKSVVPESLINMGDKILGCLP